MANDYSQQHGETYEDWKYRVILGKKDGLYDISWSEIIKLLSLSCSADYIRKIAYGIAKYRDYLREHQQNKEADIFPESSITSLDDKKFNMQREKMRMQDQKRELNKLLREWARAEHIQDEIQKAVKKLPALTNIKHKHVEASNQDGVLLLSDWHVGMKTDNFANRFDDAVLQERVEKLVSKTIEYGKLHKINCLHVFCLGDLVNGLIHVTTRINSTEDVIRQTMRASELLCAAIGCFSEAFNEVRVYFSRGNHERVTANIKESLTKESFFDMIPWYLQARLEGIENIKLIDNTLDSEIVSAEILGNIVYAVHGHRDKPGKVIESLALLTKKIPDYVFMGHFHSAAEREIQGADVIVNGSLCGADDYAMNIRKSSKPTQKFMIFNEQGRICTYNINLGEHNSKSFAVVA